ncbi:Arsenite methyltransferase (fragment) [Candidatus Desulfarcum epimagneticum]|uniref:Arsenite methyltransferase n=1 Tax=uncultured Desulfobacteraceae bacterium TaxID=218296 RepID=A0A484HLC1_9BACT
MALISGVGAKKFSPPHGSTYACVRKAGETIKQRKKMMEMSGKEGKEAAKKDDVKQMVKEKYASISGSRDSCGTCCGGGEGLGAFMESGRRLSYSEADCLRAMEAGATTLGCGNPVAEADIKAGEMVVDLGCGPGFDVFLSAEKTGKTGRVVGIDMTPEMIERAKANARRLGVENVKFRLGEIENPPLDDGEADVVMSNCVINLSADKGAVYREMFRILKPGGRISISDTLRSGDMPGAIMDDPGAWTG